MRKQRGIFWKEDTEEGEILEVKATREKKVYEFFTRIKGEEEWKPLRKIPMEYLEILLDDLELKYRRRKGSIKEVDCVKQMIVDLKSR